MLFRRLPGTGLPPARRRRHLKLSLAALGLALGFYLLLGLSPERWVDIPARKAETFEWRLSMALAYSALLFLATTLSIGPLHVLRRRQVPANIMLRRDIAIWAGFLALAHLGVAVWIHTDGWMLWGLYFWSLPSAHHPFPLRKDWFGLANAVGTAQALILLLLLGLSNNLTLRRLGVKLWKTLQRLSYFAFGLVILHGFAYQIVEQRLPVMRLFFAVIVSIVLILQAMGAATVLLEKRRRARLPYSELDEGREPAG